MRRTHARHMAVMALVWVVAVAAGGCSDSDKRPGPQQASPTPTVSVAPSGTPTATPTTPVPTATATTQAAAAVSGLVVVHQDLRAGESDALGVPPESWSQQPDAGVFDRALASADWVLAGPQAASGATGPDGQFQIPALPPGRYSLTLTKTLNGDLARAVIPFTVGDEGVVHLLVEFGLGAVRSSVRYQDGGRSEVEVRGPGGAVLRTRDGKVIEVGDATGIVVDPDGDGYFEPPVCVDHLWQCGNDRQCAAGRQCQCTASCPLCEDCGGMVCAPPGSALPYQCATDGDCALRGDRCLCVSSCPECDDCVRSVCVPSCVPVQIESITVDGVSRLVLGQQRSLRAVAQLEDGSTKDVTALVEWQSSAEGVARIDSWGIVTVVGVGTAAITAALGDVVSAPWTIEVVARPALKRILVQNLNCMYRYGVPVGERPPPDPAAAPLPVDILPPPECRQVVRIGGTLPFAALGEFEDGYFEDLTREVEWQVDPDAVGDVVAGVFTGRQEGMAQLRAVLGAIASEPTEIRVVATATIVELSIYPIDGAMPPVFIDIVGGRPQPMPADAPEFCFDCGYGITVLAGDVVRFGATAYYDTGEWEDVTKRAAWLSSDETVAAIDADGVMTAIHDGAASITATVEDASSRPVAVRVVNEATLQQLSIYQEGHDRVVAKGEQAFFRATGHYDIGFAGDVTDKVTWHSSDEEVGRFEGGPGVFVGVGAGTVELWATLDGRESNRLPFKVFESSEIDFCDPDHVNRGVWSDAFNRVVLESSCAQYTPPASAALRFTVTERERPVGVFDPCLDLFVYQGSRLVRTVREEGCGEKFLAPGAPASDEVTLRYQVSAFWDLRDERGNVVEPGVYTVYGRFYLYFDPVVSIDIAVVAPNGRIPCQDNACGNGCGYVHACGNTDVPQPCPAVCVSLCECPQGWGITGDGNCEPCVGECCPPGGSCAPGVRPCTPPKECCAPGDTCSPDLPPCEVKCCRPEEPCPDDLPRCDVLPCCPPGAGCSPEIPTCAPGCCRAGETCSDALPPCAPPQPGPTGP